VLNQRPYHALAAVRGWRDPLRLDVDDTFPATSRDLPAYGLRAEFWVHGAVEDPGPDGAAYPRLTTDQVRFYPPDAPPHHCQAGGRDYVQQTAPGQQPAAPLPLTDVPLLVFSEVMRDLDLFVTTSTIANDPTWSDGGPTQPHHQYWHACGLGPLSQIAATRRDLLAGILPRLPIATRCRLDDRYLLVRGDLHEYRVHLATSQALIGPHQRFLRLVLPPPHRLPDNLYLPVEDEMLALIVAKASLLADDTAITDPDVIRQLHDPD
jgi:hypothetical protein